MNYEVDEQFLAGALKELVECDSPVGYYPEIHELMERIVGQWGYELYTDRRATAYVRVPGRDASKTVLICAHLDTIGLIVRGINDDGTLRVRMLGGINYHNVEGETCYVHTRKGATIMGQIIHNKHSVHVGEDCRTAPRDEDNMSISIPDCTSPDDVKALGITQGAIVGVDPHYCDMGNGFVMSRHIDDKGCVAALLGELRWLAKTGEKPAFDTIFAFPMFEEIGHGGTFVPEEVEEYVAVDISLIGPDYSSDEHSVAVIASDAKGPYDWNLTNRLIACAEQACDPDKWNTQVCFHYSTDGNAASHAANDIYWGAFGPAVINSHGRERCHIDALAQTEKLCRAYLMGVA